MIASAFKPIFPNQELLNEVPLGNFQSLSRDQILDILNTNPHSFLHIIYNSKNRDLKDKNIRKEFYTESRKKFDQFIEKGILKEEEKECVVVYTQKSEFRSSTGIILLLTCKDLGYKKILGHEKTIEKKEKVFSEYINCTKINSEPVSIFAKPNQALSGYIDRKSKEEPQLDFVDDEGVEHSFVLDYSSESIDIIGDIKNLYIADGHHRAASSLLNYLENPAEKFFLACVFPNNQITIDPFYKVITIGDSDKSKIQNQFKNLWKPITECDFDSDSAKLFIEDQFAEIDKETNLDTIEFIHDNILQELLNVTDIRSDKRIKHIGGRPSKEQTMKLLNEGKLIVLLPTLNSFDIMHAANSQSPLPPKVSFIHPKIKTGLVNYLF